MTVRLRELPADQTGTIGLYACPGLDDPAQLVGMVDAAARGGQLAGSTNSRPCLRSRDRVNRRTHIVELTISTGWPPCSAGWSAMWRVSKARPTAPPDGEWPFAATCGMLRG
jgi:hypothetical protein